jgi:taurine dioxygenase
MYLDRIAELHPDESTVLLSHLHEVTVDPNRTIRWHWTEGDIAIWDESATLHRALGDHHPSIRRMRRCTTDGGTRPSPVARPDAGQVVGPVASEAGAAR